ncbi:MAG: hypothetical protein V1901_03735 [Patescibacteria group bacterium]
MAEYPNIQPTFINPNAGDKQNSPSHSQIEIKQNQEIAAICVELGLNVKGAYTTLVARLDALPGGHSHSNMTILNSIQEALTTAIKVAYDDAVTKAHAHSNKAILDNIQEAFTTALKSSYDSAVSSAHSHSNITVLNNIQEALTTALKSNYDAAYSHSQAAHAPADAVSLSTVKADTDIADALTKKHTQNTDTVLQKIGGTDILKINGFVGEFFGLNFSSVPNYFGQTFTVIDGGNVSKIQLMLSKPNDLVDGNIYLEIRETSDGLPTETVLGTSETINFVDLNIIPIFSYPEFIFSLPVTLVPGQYAIVCITTDPSVGVACIGDGIETYSGGQLVTYNGATWSDVSFDEDLYFKIYINIDVVDIINNGTLKNNLLVDNLITIDGRYISVDGTKLDTIEENSVGLITIKADADISSAISLKHTQGTDQGLDTGGANEVTAPQAKAGYTHSGVTSGNPHSVTKSDVGLGNVDNVSEATIISDVKADSDVASAISLKHASGSDAETASTIATIITGAGAETPLDADEFPFYKIVGTILKKVTWLNIKATLKTYFDGLYRGKTNSSKSFIITNPTSASDSPVWRSPTAITITGIHVLCIGGTNIIGQLIEFGSNGLNPQVIDDSDITGIAGTNVNDDGDLSNPNIDAGDYIGWHTTSVSGVVTKVIITFDYTII